MVQFVGSEAGRFLHLQERKWRYTIVGTSVNICSIDKSVKKWRKHARPSAERMLILTA